METVVYDPSAADDGEPPREDDAAPAMETVVAAAGDDMETVVEEPARTGRVLYRLALVEHESGDEYVETDSWMIEVGRTYAIGRSSTCDIVVAASAISRKHAELAVQPDGTVVLTDLGSSHGTYVNGERIGQPRRIAVGDDIRLTQRGAALLALLPVGL